ncbi:hypothetical protein Chor_005969 [Crotalus horridus]
MEKFPVATCLTILLTLLVSGLGLLQRSRNNGLPDDFLSGFLLRPAAVREGQVYRLVTYIFVYEDVISLVCSAVIIWYFAGSFEKMVGTVKHSFLTLVFAVSLALLYLVLRTMASGMLKMTDAEGFAPVAFAMLAASIARSRMRRTVLFGVNVHMTLSPALPPPAGAMGELCIQNHSHSPAGLPPVSHLVGANSWMPVKTDKFGIDYMKKCSQLVLVRTIFVKVMLYIQKIPVSIYDVSSSKEAIQHELWKVSCETMRIFSQAQSWALFCLTDLASFYYVLLDGITLANV